jgi:excisionase family DNA binding protein
VLLQQPQRGTLGGSTALHLERGEALDVETGLAFFPERLRAPVESDQHGFRKTSPKRQAGCYHSDMGKREQQQVAYAVVELQDIHDELRKAAPQPADKDSDAISVALHRLEEAVERLDRAVPNARGLPVAEAAEYLGVSEPTIRAWLDRTVLDAVPDSKPVLVERSSLRRVHRAVGELRRRGQDRDWLRALVDVVHDHAERERPEIAAGVDELARGELEPA